MLYVMPPSSASQRGTAIRRSSFDPIDIEMRIAAITVLQKQEEVDVKSHGETGKGMPNSFTGRVVPNFPGQDFPDPLTAVLEYDTMSAAPLMDDYGITLVPSSAGPVIEAHMMQLHALRHYPLIDQHYFSQQECYLNKTILRWEFDVLKCEESSAQGVLKDVGLKLVELYGLIDEFSLSLVSLHQTFQLIQGSYHNNPYHNAAHAADVVQAACCLIAEPKIWKHMTMLERLAMIMAGACHDLDHPGVNQAFLKTTNHYLTEAAKKYPKPNIGAESTAVDEPCVMSVLEIHHIRHAVAIFDQTRVFAHFSEDTYLELLRTIRELILATDMAFQGKYMEKLKRLNKDYHSLETEHERDAFFACEDTRRFYLQISLKCADICNTCRPWEVSQKWSRRVTEEFFSQGDKERVLSLPINEINDRTRTTIEKVQVGFLKFVARPLFVEWNNLHNSDSSLSLIKNIDDNLANWGIVQKKHLEISSKAATVASAADLKESSINNQSPVDTSRDVATVIKTPTESMRGAREDILKNLPSSMSSLPQMPSDISILDRPMKPQDDSILDRTMKPDDTDTSEASADLRQLEVKATSRKLSIPCAFVSLDHSVAIIQDNLRIQSQSECDEDGVSATATVDASPKVSTDDLVKETRRQQGKVEVDGPKDEKEHVEWKEGSEIVERVSPLDVEMESGEIEPAASKHIVDSDHSDLPAVACATSKDPSCNIDELPQTHSSYHLEKPQSEILQSSPPGHSHSQRLDASSDQQQEQEDRTRLEGAGSVIENVPDARNSPGLSRGADSGTLMVEPSGTNAHMPLSNLVEKEEAPEKHAAIEDTIIEEDPDLNAYAKLTSPPPYRKSIMLTVDKSLERLRAMHAKSPKGTGSGVSVDEFQSSRISHAVAYEKSILTKVKSKRPAAVTEQKEKAHKEKEKDRNKTSCSSKHVAKKTTSQRSETLFLPSSTSEEVLTPDGASEYNRQRINQSRSNFFQSLLPTSLLKSNYSTNSTNTVERSTSGPGSHKTSGSLYISSPRNKRGGDGKLLTESSDALCDGGQVNTQIRNHSVVRFPSFPILDSELEPNGPEEVMDLSICLQNSDMAKIGENSTFINLSGDCNTTPDKSPGLLTSTPSYTTDTERRPSRSMHASSATEKASSKRSQSASARIAKTFQRLLTGSRSSTHRAGAVSGNRSAAVGAAATTKATRGSSHQKQMSVSSSKGANVQSCHEKSALENSDCSTDLQRVKNSNCENEDTLR